MDCYNNRLVAGEIYFTCWMDNKPVHMISTLFTKITRNAKTPQGVYELVTINCPTVVKSYNRGMGGQLGSYYKDRHRSFHWQMRLITHFLRVSVVCNKCFNTLQLR